MFFFSNILFYWFKIEFINCSYPTLFFFSFLFVAVENARKLYQDAENEVNQLNTELEKIKNDLAVDYGIDREWLKLKDVCIEKDEGE